jgi:hypothetical protein
VLSQRHQPITVAPATPIAPKITPLSSEPASRPPRNTLSTSTMTSGSAASRSVAST